MTAISLTARQQKFFEYFLRYHKENGVFPTMSQGSRDLKVSVTSVTNMYGALLLKGAFTNGNTLVAGNGIRRRKATDVVPVNISSMKFQSNKKLRKHYTPRALTEQLNKLIEAGDPTAKKLADMLGM